MKASADLVSNQHLKGAGKIGDIGKNSDILKSAKESKKDSMAAARAKRIPKTKPSTAMTVVVPYSPPAKRLRVDVKQPEDTPRPAGASAV